MYLFNRQRSQYILERLLKGHFFLTELIQQPSNCPPMYQLQAQSLHAQQWMCQTCPLWTGLILPLSRGP